MTIYYNNYFIISIYTWAGVSVYDNEAKSPVREVESSGNCHTLTCHNKNNKTIQ